VFNVLESGGRARTLLMLVLEIMIVIVGVFLGLQAQEWASDRADRMREAHFVRRIERDFSAIVEDAQSCLAVYRESSDAINRVRMALAETRSGGTEMPPDGLEAALIAMTAGTMPPGRSAAYVEMISAGDLSLIVDDELREALVEYDQEALTNRDTWLSLRESLTPVMPNFFRHVDVRSSIDRSQTSIAGYTLAGMAADTEFPVVLGTLTAVAANSYQLCERQSRVAAAVASAVEE